MLDFVGRGDGSAGRLFYDSARSCKFLHPPGSTGSSSVMQRNPYTRNHEMGWMNIVELSYNGHGANRNYHGHHLISKGSGVLGRIKRETRCEIQICGDMFNFPTNRLCPPYCWIFGETPGSVDRAAEIVNKAIQNHMSTCNCRL